MLRLLVSACCFLLPLAGTAHAQTIQGRVTDGETGQPLPGAAVLLPTADLGATTTSDGRYTLALPTPGAYRVVFRFVGYKTETRSITLSEGGTSTLDVVLAPSFVEVGDVTVTAKANAADLLSTPQSVAIVDERALDRSAGGTPMDALDDVAGVRLLRTGPAIAKPVIRGLTSQRVLIVADGVRQEGQQWGDEHGPEIGGADVDRIEVVRGPLSLLYGSDALGGVIQTTHDGLFAYDDALAGEATATGLTGTNQGAATLTLGGRAGAWAYEARGGGLRAGQIDTPDGLLPNTAQENWTASGRLGYEWAPQSRVIATAGWFDTTLGLFEPEFLDDGEAPDLSRYEIGEPSQRVQHGRLGLRADVPLGRNRLEIITALQQNRRQEFEGEEAEAGPVSGDAEPALFLRLTTGTADVRLHHRPVGKLFGTVGVSGMWQENETLAEETLIPAATTLNGAIYVTEELVLPTLTLDAGLRFDARALDVQTNDDLGVLAQTRSYTALTGALGAAWQPRGDFSLALNVGRAFRAPQLIELFGNGVHEGTLRFERGAVDLTPESNLSLDGVARYRTPHVYAEVSGFVNQIDAYIFPRATAEIDPESGFVIYDFTQANARLVGAEFRLDIHPHALHGLGLHFSGDATRGTNRETDVPLPFIPPARLRSAVEYKAEQLGPARDLEARFGPTFVAAQDRPELPEEIPTDASIVWDLSLGAAFPSGGLTITPMLSVDNLFDTAYVDPLSRFRPYGVFAPGRSVRLSLRVGF
ncbi:MAG: TonB-dependent receptor [Rhodothermaceae bacterium]|nr:TonB-dependent receptor [Rhodothermaceae bacterium]